MTDNKHDTAPKEFKPSRAQIKQMEHDGTTPKSIRRSLISETTRNIDSIANHINEGQVADKELMIKLINRMIAFLNEFVRLPDGNKPETDTHVAEAVEKGLDAAN